MEFVKIFTGYLHRKMLCFVFVKAIPHKERLATLHAICVQIFRHIAQKSLAIRQYACGISRQSAEKSDNAPYAQALCGIAFTKTKHSIFLCKYPVKILTNSIYCAILE